MAATSTPRRAGPILTKRQKATDLPDFLAYTRLFLLIAGRFLKYNAHYLAGKTPPGQSYAVGCGVVALQPAEENLTIPQTRAFLRLGIKIMDAEAGIGSEEQKSEWMKKVQGQGWEGYWMPFQDQLTAGEQGLSKKEMAKAAAEGRRKVMAETPLGGGCDVVIQYTHGGGFMDGNARMFIDIFRRWMKSAQQHQSLRIGFLSIEYSLSPETPFPGALNECIAAYHDLVKVHGVEPTRIIMVGDSAGGNLCITVPLKIRDAFPDLALPAGIIAISPYMGSPEPFECSLYDYISPIGCQSFVEYYTQHDPEILSSLYFSPLNKGSITGLPPMLVFCGGIECFRSSIEQFADKAREDGVHVELVVGKGRSHDYVVVPQICTEQDLEDTALLMAQFAARVCSNPTPGNS